MKCRKTAVCLSALSALFLILFFFSPLSAAAEGDDTVRVLLTRLALTDRLDVSLDGNYTLKDISFQRGSHLVISCASSRLMVYYEGMALECGDSLHLIRHRLSEDADNSENGLRLNGAYFLHPGDLCVTVEAGSLRAVLHAPVEEYLLGVVPYEMSDSYPLEALKVQAICSRTYVLNKKSASTGDWDVVDNTNDQAYYGIQAEFVRSAEAVRLTEGICGFDRDGRLIDCYYSASNGGQTECVSHVWGGTDRDYLPVQADPYDLENPASTVLSYAVGKNGADGFGALEGAILSSVRAALDPAEDPASVTAEDLTIVSCALSGPMYPGSMVYTGLSMQVRAALHVPEADDGDGEVYFDPESAESAEAFEVKNETAARRTVSVTLPVFGLVEPMCYLDINRGSSNEIYTVRETDSAFVIEARRFGHGVGMSQRGAQRMAAEYGKSCDEILSFYYPGAVFRRASLVSSPLPTAVGADFLTTPGPAATPTPRPTLMPVENAAARGQYMVIVSNIGEGSYLNLRSQPSMNASVLRQLYYGQLLCVLDETGDGWLHVCTDSAEGYVSAAFVAPVQ